MSNFVFSGTLKTFIDRAESGNPGDIDFLMQHLTHNASLATTRFIDYSLGLVCNTTGIERIKFYLFNGCLIQRNYACLFFNRINEWKIVKEAYSRGLVDEIQAFSR